jgi:hypothetical protein
MRKKALKKIAILAAPIIWRKLRGRRGRHRWHRRRHWSHGWHRGHHRKGHKRRGIWL